MKTRLFIFILFSVLLSPTSHGLKISDHRPNVSVPMDSTCKIMRKKADGFGLVCTGTLISEPFPATDGSIWVLSAAHCGSDPKDAKTEFYVQCGLNAAHTTPVSAQFIPHPKFKFGNKSSDIALFRLSSPIFEKTSRVLETKPLEELIQKAQAFHEFKVETIDRGVPARFDSPRFSKEYTYIHEDRPLVSCAVVGYGFDSADQYGDLQSQALGITYFLDLSLIHLFMSMTETQHGVMTRPGDSGGPILCQSSQGSFVLGVHSHSMEHSGYSYATPTNAHAQWIKATQELWYQVAEVHP